MVSGCVAMVSGRVAMVINQWHVAAAAWIYLPVTDGM